MQRATPTTWLAVPRTAADSAHLDGPPRAGGLERKLASECDAPRREERLPRALDGPVPALHERLEAELIQHRFAGSRAHSAGERAIVEQRSCGFVECGGVRSGEAVVAVDHGRIW